MNYIFNFDSSMMIICMNNLVGRFEVSGHRSNEIVRADAPKSWSEWIAFIQGAYEFGFVSPEIIGTPELSLLVQQATEKPTSVDNLEFEQLRQIIHFLVRSERWGDLDSATGGGPLWDALCSGALQSIANRLETIAAPDG